MVRRALPGGGKAPLQSALLSLDILVAARRRCWSWRRTSTAELARELARPPLPAQLVDLGVDPQRARGGSLALGLASPAIASALVFGIGFGHVLQLVHARRGSFDLSTGMADPDRSCSRGSQVAAVLLLQLNDFHTRSSVVKALLGIGWVGS